MQDQWVKDLERAFAPYSKFVEDVVYSLEQISSETKVPVSSRPNRDPKRVLVLDQVEVNRVLLGHYFKRLPVQLEYASTIEVARDLIQTKSFDLLAVDVALSLAFKEAGLNIPCVTINSKETPKDQILQAMSMALWPQNS